MNSTTSTKRTTIPIPKVHMTNQEYEDAAWELSLADDALRDFKFTLEIHAQYTALQARSAAGEQLSSEESTKLMELYRYYDIAERRQELSEMLGYN